MHSATFCKPNSVTHIGWGRQLLNNPLKTSLQSLMPTISQLSFLWILLLKQSSGGQTENELELNIPNVISRLPSVALLSFKPYLPDNGKLSSLSFIFYSRSKQMGAPGDTLQRKTELSQVTYTFLTKWHTVLFTTETFLLSYQYG